MTATGIRLIGKSRFNAAVHRLALQKMARLSTRFGCRNREEEAAILNRAIIPSVAIEFGQRMASRLVGRR